jgi:hypothetical protein
MREHVQFGLLRIYRKIEHGEVTRFGSQPGIVRRQLGMLKGNRYGQVLEQNRPSQQARDSGSGPPATPTGASEYAGDTVRRQHGYRQRQEHVETIGETEQAYHEQAGP